ncbi:MULTISPECIES: regulatory protein RecX [unclassified Prosthecochloris]|uniref:regulatory protein RecX n=1 Tax=unclassified Prosthecochloris TaxID=2632826 RepID=UPI00223CA47C|nr:MULTISPECIES: regulatory protein RecX [unclassified Prosthecochloris]UZJ38104.1 recombination regulator RecX [Prosthecochloris sp. SCSIO W1103]
MTENSDKKAFELAIRYLGNREHSRKEIVTKLERRQFSPEAVKKTLERLDELGLLDDRSFALNYIGSKSRKKPSGRYKLRYELLQKGVSEEIIEEVLNEYDSSGYCLDAALKKLPFLKGDDHYRRRKLHTFLMNRGFDSQTIRQTLDQIFRS